MTARWVLQNTQAVGGLPAASYTSQSDPYARAMMLLNPTAYWRMADTDLVLRDSTGRYSGTYTGGTRNLTSLHRGPGRAFQTATSGTVGTSAVLPAMSVWSIVAWAKSITNANFNFMLNFGPQVGGQLVRFGSGNSGVSESEGNGWTTSAITWSFGEVIHLAATFDGVTCRVYKNGTFGANFTRVAHALGSTTWDLNSDNSGGVIQDVAILDRVLTAAEISALYGAGR